MEFVMNASTQITHIIPNHSLEIANLYHKQSLELINLALSHNKHAIEASHKRASELLEVKDTNKVNELVSSHMTSQVKDYLVFAVAAYKLGFDAHIQATKLLHQQVEDGYVLANDTLNAHARSGNSIHAVAMTVVKTALDASNSAMESAKEAAKKVVASAKSLSVHSK
jgi:hypothetical protein